MRIDIDREKCCGFGNCVLLAPELFDLDDKTNLAIALVTELDAGQRPDAERVIDECPTLAISLVE